jgi:four helix bundle protein
MTKERKERDLEDRLIDFAVRVIRVADMLPKTKAGAHISGQIVRSGTAPAPNYGEARDAESRADFIHKMKIALKELRETKIWLLISGKSNMVKPITKLEPLIDECNQLISIFVASVKTAKQNKVKKT